MMECVIEPIYQYHSLCLGKNECVLTNPEYYKDIRGCYEQGNGTNHFIMQYFCDASKSIMFKILIQDRCQSSDDDKR